MKYAPTLAAVVAAIFSTTVAYTPQGYDDMLDAIAREHQQESITEDAPAWPASTSRAESMEVTGVETITSDDHYVAFGQPVATMTTVVAEPMATRFDMRQCLSENKEVMACEQERRNLRDTIHPPIQGGACEHSEGPLHYRYILGGAGDWHGSHCENIEHAAREVSANKVTEFKCEEFGNENQFVATWRMLKWSRKAVDNHLHKIKGAPKYLSCKPLTEDVYKEMQKMKQQSTAMGNAKSGAQAGSAAQAGSGAQADSAQSGNL